MIDFITILIPVISFWFACITGIPQRFKFAFKRSALKPFDCSKCLSFWIALIYQIPHFSFWTTLSICAINSLAAYLLEFFAEKFKLPINK